MCGLSGIIVTKPELLPIDFMKAIFSLLMEENDDRGGHSWGAWGTGVAPIRALGKYATDRKPLFTALKDFKYAETGPTFLFGHTRFATHGTRTTDNAHPFEIGNLIIAHNGIVDVEGFDSTDHAVDSARIGLAAIKHGWKDGMAKVNGSCGLLLSVGGEPIIYRDGQVLSYATMPWGTIVCSLKTDLELVVSKKLGLEMLTIGDVPEGTLCQPGFGDVNFPAPTCDVVPVYQDAWRGGFTGHWSDRDADEWPALGTCSGTRRGRGTIANFSGKSDLPATATDPIKTLNAQSKVQEVGRQSAFRKLMTRAEVHEAGGVDCVDFCSYCGYEQPTEDLYHAMPGWAHSDMVYCIDCIVDEIADQGEIVVLGKYGHYLPEQGADELDYIEYMEGRHV